MFSFIGLLLGYFLEPTVFTDVEDHMMIAKEESFGPIMIVSVFENGSVVLVCIVDDVNWCVISSDIDGVLRRANATEFGLASGVFTQDINKVSDSRWMYYSWWYVSGYVCKWKNWSRDLFC